MLKKYLIGLMAATMLICHTASPLYCPEWLANSSCKAMEVGGQAAVLCGDTKDLGVNIACNTAGFCSDLFGRCKSVLGAAYTFADKHPHALLISLVGGYIGWKWYNWKTQTNHPHSGSSASNNNAPAPIINNTNINFHQK